MPNPQLSWQELHLLTTGDPGVIEIFRDNRFVGRLTFCCPDQLIAEGSWTHTGSSFATDEIEWHWACGPAQLSIRLSTSPHLSWRIALSSDQPVTMKPPLLKWTPAAPARYWAGGSRGLLVLDERPSDGNVLVAQLSLGFVEEQARNNLIGEDKRILSLGPATLNLGPNSRYISTWSVQNFPSITAASAQLPSWIPADLTVQSGDEIRIGMPDAIVSIDNHDHLSHQQDKSVKGIHMSTDDHGSLISASTGTHPITVVGPHVDARLLATWDIGSTHVLSTFARRILSQIDPRTAQGAETALVYHADINHLVSHNEATEFITTFCIERIENLPHYGAVGPTETPHIFSPEETPVLINWLLTHPEMDTSIMQKSAWQPDPGAFLAWSNISMLAHVYDFPFTAPAPIDPTDSLCMALHAVLSRSPKPTEAVLAATKFLHGPLPGPLPSNNPVRTAQACAILSMAPAQWNLDDRIGIPLGQAIEDTRAWLINNNPGANVLSWALWQF